MPAPKVGSYIAYKVDAGGNNSKAPQLDGKGFLPGQTKSAVVRVFSQPNSRVEAGTIWSFTFLLYVPGAVTTAPLSGPLMTGPMSGCYLFTYRDGDTPSLAHVGTGEKTSQQTKDVKNKWKTFADANLRGGIVGGSPLDSFTAKVLLAAAQEGGQGPTIVGYFESGKLHAMLLAAVPGVKEKMKIFALEEMKLQPWDAVRKTDKFADLAD